ncbi:3-hydroxyacyl-CoA dehydrogenase [Alkalibacterium psychrotolerans]
MNIKRVMVAGGGVLGSQIAMQTAYHGFDVVLYDINEESIDSAKERMDKITNRYREDLDATDEKINEAYNRLSYSTDKGEAVKGVDLVIEAIPEVIKIKTEFYEELGTLADEHTIFATNTSTLLPSQFAEATGRPEKFLALHFANEIWKNNTAEIMKHDNTDMEIFEQIAEFSEDIGMVALRLYKEQPGYILNTLLVPLLNFGLALYTKQVADIETIDKTWMIGTGAPKGPFAFLDIIGITTAYNVIKTRAEETGDEGAEKLAAFLKKEYIDKNKLGVATGEGFYTYPNPRFEDPDFLT